MSLRALSHAFSVTCIYIVQMCAYYASYKLLYAFITLQSNGKMAVNRVTRDFRVRLPKSQIIRLTKGTVEEYDKMCNVQKPSSELQAYVMLNECYMICKTVQIPVFKISFALLTFYASLYFFGLAFYKICNIH